MPLVLSLAFFVLRTIVRILRFRSFYSLPRQPFDVHHPPSNVVEKRIVKVSQRFQRSVRAIRRSESGARSLFSRFPESVSPPAGPSRERVNTRFSRSVLTVTAARLSYPPGRSFISSDVPPRFLDIVPGPSVSFAPLFVHDSARSSTASRFSTTVEIRNLANTPARFYSNAQPERDCSRANRNERTIFQIKKKLEFLCGIFCIFRFDRSNEEGSAF